MSKMTGSRLIAEMLRDYGVSHLFYVPAILLKGMAEMEGMGIRRIMTHGEKSAVYMADGYARASGKPGICLSQQIGASNLAAGLRDAYMASAPLIAITGGHVPSGRYRNAYQEVEDMSQFDAVTKFNVRVDDLSRLPDMLRQAFRAATSGAPRPVHLQLRGLHGQVADGEAELSAMTEAQFSRIPAFRPVADAAAIREVAKQLAAAQRPLIVAGGGVMSSGAQAEVLALAERKSIPVATSLNAKSAIVDQHPLAVGVVGTYSRECANRAVHEADLVFFIGSRTGGQTTVNWKIPGSGTRVIQLDIEPLELGRNYPNSASLVGDAKATLQQLLAVIPAEPSAAMAAWVARVQKLVADWRAGRAPLRDSDAVPMRPERICKEISETLPDNGVVVSDTGHSGMWTGVMVELRHASQRYIRCAGSMGWGFPGAMGVKCALPDQPVVCFTGDGAFYYHIGELETAARFGINLVVVVNNNNALNQEIPLWDKAFDGVAQGHPEDLWKFRITDFAQVAESFGCIGMRASTPAELRAALQKAYTLNRPVVIDAASDVKAFAKKAWTPEGAAGGY
ncbi:MAG: thiamine pyrophosphate-binding protein [Betaproteobacteria bacterium]